MNSEKSFVMDASTSHFSAHTLPRWDNLPDLELYMDQILSLADRFLGSYPGYDRILTASMVNNYVKLGIIPPPVKKRYTRAHLAYLLMICILKNSLSISGIKSLINTALNETEIAVFYDRFCDEFERSVMDTVTRNASMASDAVSAVLSAALRAQAEQALANSLYTELISSDRQQ